MTQYAHATTVTKTATLADLERVLTRHGATSFIAGTHNGQATIAFEVTGLSVLMRIPLPELTDRRFTHTPTGQKRDPSAVHTNHQAAIRATWRALLLFVKAKLVGVEQGLTTLEQEFLPHILLPDGSTVRDHTLPAIRQAYAAGIVPPMLPTFTPRAIEGP